MGYAYMGENTKVQKYHYIQYITVSNITISNIYCIYNIDISSYWSIIGNNNKFPKQYTKKIYKFLSIICNNYINTVSDDDSDVSGRIWHHQLQ